MIATCRCGRSWSGGRPEHCPACHETFVGTSAGDRHRVGDHSPVEVAARWGLRELGTDGRWRPAAPVAPSRRRCLTREEMRAGGMDTDDRGLWFIAADRERLSQAMSSRTEVPG